MFWVAPVILAQLLPLFPLRTNMCYQFPYPEQPGQKFDVHGSVHHNTNLKEMTNKMQRCWTIYYSTVS